MSWVVARRWKLVIVAASDEGQAPGTGWADQAAGAA